MPAALEHSKNRIRRELDNVIKLVASRSAIGPLSSDVEQLVCNVIEAVFIHGLMDAFFLKGSRFSRYPEPNIWPFISKFTHGSIKKQILALKQIKTEIGKSRAWIRIVLNEGALEHYIQMITRDETQLAQFYVKQAFLRDSEKIETLTGYLKTLAKVSLNSSINSTVLNNWNPRPLILSGLITEKNPLKKDSIFSGTVEDSQTQLDTPVNSAFSRLASQGLDDDKSSIYSHPSMLDQTEPIRHSFQNVLAGTPENEQILTFQDIGQRSSDVVVRHKRGRLRSLSKSSNGSLPTISRNTSNTSLNALPFENDLIKSAPSITTDNDTHEETVDGSELEMSMNTEIEPSSPLNDSSFRSMSLHDEFVLSGFNNEDSGVSGGNSIQGYIWSSSARDISTLNQSSFSSASSGPPTVSFDAEMRSVLEQQSADESDKKKTSDSCQPLKIENELKESELILDNKSEVDVVEIELKETDEFGNEKEMIRMITEIQNETGLASQKFRCFSCRKSIGGSSFLPFKVCGFDAKYYCEECMRGNESPIPSRIILNWDHKPRPICRASKDFLKNIYDRPIIRIDKVNPLLYENAPQLAHIHKLRTKLSQSAIYLLTCKKSVADDLKRRLYPHDYLYTDLNLYSIKDLESVMTGGVLERRLNIVIDFAVEHIMNCPLCIQKGFVCEICKSRKVIYPFNLELTNRCKKCFAVYHIECFKDENCPKCIRLAKKEALAKEADFVFK